MTRRLLDRQASLAFLYAAPIGLLGGLIGLGGAEFRLPVLAGPLGYPVRQAVPLNLAVSLVTLAVAFLTRAGALSLQPVVPFLPAVGGLIAGAVLTAFIGATVASRLSEERFERIILVLLVAISIALIGEAFLPLEMPGPLPSSLVWHVSAGIVFGLAIGLVSSLLGVAGGELIIPTLVFAFGADIKTAGTASLLVSLPTVVVAVVRYAGRSAFTDRGALLKTVLPMSLGSLIGVVVGGMLVGIISPGVLKVALGVILNVSALQIFRRTRSSRSPEIGAEKVSPLSPVPVQQEIVFATTTSVWDTDLLNIIVPVFERESGYQVKAVAVGTGQALALARKSEADVVLAHAPDTEKKYIADGTLVRRRLVMHNSFVLAGPATDPAKIKGTVKAVDALKKIAAAKATFVSRGDDSGTHQLEKRLWEQVGIEPIGEWYLESSLGMGSTLKLAGEQQAYIIADRATYLACLKTTDLVVLVEDAQVFLNIYHVLEVNPEKFPKVHRGGKALADFLLSATVQDMLKMFGVDKFGEPLFYPDAGRTEVDLLQRQ